MRSIIGRFLEHSRVYYFENDGAPEIYCGSADWMDRNFFSRVEVAFRSSVTSSACASSRPRTYLWDNTHAWIMAADGSYLRSSPGDATPVAAQLALLEALVN